MTVSILKSGQAGGTNPSVTLNSVAAGDTLLVLAAEADNNAPGTPTDTSGDAFTLIDDFIGGAGGVSLAIYHCLRSAGGREAIRVPTTATARMIAAELSGVATPVQQTLPDGRTFWLPYVPDGLCDLQTIGGAISLNYFTENPTGAMVFAFCAAAGGATMTFSDPAWTSLLAGTALGLAYDIRALQVSAPASGQVTWTLSAPSQVMAAVWGMPAA